VQIAPELKVRPVFRITTPPLCGRANGYGFGFRFAVRLQVRPRRPFPRC
jgi:hypothetical protein